MKYDFTSIIDRAGRDALAVDMLPDAWGEVEVIDGCDYIPMWVADMNFATVPAATKAIIDRASHPTYGYFLPRDEYFENIMWWHKTRKNDASLTRESIGYENGVLGGVASALAVLCSKGDSVLVHSPTYVGFTGVLTNNGYNIVHSELVQDEKGIYRMNYEDMEQKLVDNQIHTAIFCSPHNPTGRVWERWEIEKAMELFRKHKVYVISDEIWSDIILGDNVHIPTQTVSEDAKQRTVAVYAPSKTFNLAGLIGSYHVIHNEWLRDRIRKESSLGHYNSMNLLSMYALIGAYSEEGDEWTSELVEVIGANVDWACDFIEREFEGISVTKPQGTYMLYLDCREYCEKKGITLKELLKKGFSCGVFWQDGEAFCKEYTIRMNLALPHSRMVEAFERLKKYVFSE